MFRRSSSRSARHGSLQVAVSRAMVESLECRRLLSAGTIRVATYNIDGDTTDFASNNQSATLETVLEGIASVHLNDNGTSNAQLPDVLGFEELQNGIGGADAPTLATIVSNLNAKYGAGTYAYDTTADPNSGNTTGNGPSGLVYDTKTIQVISATPLGTVSSSGEARAPMEYKLQPVGFTSAADFYVIVSHAKSGTTSSDATRRNVEAQTVTSAIASLGSGAHVIVMGDFNITGGSAEASYGTYETKLDDVAHPSGSWADSTVANAQAIAGLLTESATSDHYRDDIQFVSPAADPASSSKTNGLQYDSSSMLVFGNGGATTIVSHAVTDTTNNPGALSDLSSTQRTSVLSAETTTTDHLPVVADYSLVGMNVPTIGSFTASPTSVTAGSSVTLTASNVTESGGTISSVKFYRESNGTSGLQTSGDTVLGTGTQSGSTWTISTSTSGLAAGTYTYYAVATDGSGVSSAASSTTITVTTSGGGGGSSGPVLTWNVSGQTGYGTQGLAATSVAAGVTNSTGLTRGSGVTTSGTAASNAWGGNGWASTSSAGISGNEYATFAVTVGSGEQLSLSSIDMNYRRSSTGPTSGYWQYEIGTGAWTLIGDYANEFSSTSTSGAAITEINLAGVSALQNLAAGTKVTFRVVPYGSTSSAGTWYVYHVSSADLLLSGTISSTSSGAAAPAVMSAMDTPATTTAPNALLASDANLLGKGTSLFA